MGDEAQGLRLTEGLLWVKKIKASLRDGEFWGSAVNHHSWCSHPRSQTHLVLSPFGPTLPSPKCNVCATLMSRQGELLKGHRPWNKPRNTNTHCNSLYQLYFAWSNHVQPYANYIYIEREIDGSSSHLQQLDSSSELPTQAQLCSVQLQLPNPPSHVDNMLTGYASEGVLTQ